MVALKKKDLEKLIRDAVGNELADIRAENEDAAKKGAGVKSSQSIAWSPDVIRRAGDPRANLPANLGKDFAGFLGLLAFTQGDIKRALDHGKKNGASERVLRALGESDHGSGGVLVPPSLQPEVIEYLRAVTVVRAAGPREVPLVNGTATFPRVATGAQSSWMQENEDTPYSEAEFDDIQLVGRQHGVITAVSKQLVEHAGPDMAGIIRDDLGDAASEAEDLTFLRSPGTSKAPRGFLHLAHADNKFDANGTVSAENVIADLGKLYSKPGIKKVRTNRRATFMSERTRWFLMTLTNDQGNFVFYDEMSKGTLLGAPFFVGHNIPENLGSGTNESEIYHAEMTSVLLGTDKQMSVEFSDVAAYNAGGGLVSAFQRNQIVAKLWMSVDLQVRQDGKEIAVLQKVKWGA